jgi:hypothetical protein
MEVFRIFPYLSYDNHELLTAQIDLLSTVIRARHEYLILDHQLFPVATKQQLAVWRNQLRDEYLQQRSEVSTRNIKWTDLTVTFATKVLDTDKQRPSGRRQIMKLVYDKYYNSQYGERINNCPLCHQGPDIRAHLVNCQCEQARAINTNTDDEAERLPVPEGIQSRILLSTKQTLLLKRTVLTMVQSSTLTRLGLFNKEDRHKLLSLFHNDSHFQKTPLTPAKICTSLFTTT